MKPLIVASALLVLAAPVFASPMHPTPAEKKDIITYDRANQHCGGYDGDDIPDLVKACAVADKFAEKLKRQGFCIYGHGVAGRAGKKGHCYTIDWHPD